MLEAEYYDEEVDELFKQMTDNKKDDLMKSSFEQYLE